MNIVYDFDYETYYSKTYSIKDLGNWGYTHHPEFDAYLLTVEATDGYEWAGNPKDFDWKKFDGATMVAHNAGFEEAVTNRLKELAVIPAGIEFAALFDTADLAAYLGAPRSLAGAAETLLDIKVDKGMRDKAKGKHWSEMTPDFQEAMIKYGKFDSKVGLKLFTEFGHLWPDWERELSLMTREMCSTGLPVDLPAIEAAVKKLQVQLWKVRTCIPWASDPDTPALSPKLVAEECRKNKIPPPKSMAKDSEEFEEWLRTYKDLCPWAPAVGQYRRINALLKKLVTMKERTKPNGIMTFGLKYGGAHTLRDSGDTGFNVQNLSRVPFFFDDYGIITEANRIDECVKGWKKDKLPDYVKFLVDMRGYIVAPPGKMLGVCDLAAIEPCVLAVFSEDWEMVKLLKSGMDVYEAHARTTKRYDNPEPLKEIDNKLRQYMKVEVLGLGYGAGAEKGVVIAKTLAGLDIPLNEMKLIVDRFRRRKFIPNLWNKLEQAMRLSSPKDYEVELPSGRTMRYRDVRSYGGLTAVIPRLGRMMRLGFWGGTLTENITQAAARDVFMDRVIELKKEGMPPILRVHDEAVSIFDEDKAQEQMNLMEQIMGTTPKWWPELPIAAEGHLCKQYRK